MTLTPAQTHHQTDKFLLGVRVVESGLHLQRDKNLLLIQSMERLVLLFLQLLTLQKALTFIHSGQPVVPTSVTQVVQLESEHPL